jgi:hypothetical protein
MARSALEGIPQALSQFGVEERRVGVFDQRQTPMRSQAQNPVTDGTFPGFLRGKTRKRSVSHRVF